MITIFTLNEIPSEEVCETVQEMQAGEKLTISLVSV